MLRYEADLARRRVRVVFDVTPGPAVRIASTRLLEVPEPFEPPARGLVETDPHGIFTEDRVERTASALRDLLQSEGFADAAVQTAVDRSGPALVNVTYHVAAGTRYRFSRVRVEGVAPDLETLAARTVGIAPGTLYSPTHLRNASDRLRLLGLFRQIRLDTEPAAPGGLTVRCQLAERKQRTLEVGLGYWSDDQIRAHADWEHRNLFLRGRGFSVGGSYSRFQQSAAVTFWQPGVFGIRTHGRVALRGLRESEESYELLSASVEPEIIALLGPSASLRLAVSASYVDFTAIAETEKEPTGSITAVSASWKRDTSGDRVSPRSGSASQLAVEYTPPGLGSEARYVTGEAKVASYRTIMSPLVLATRVHVGLGAPLGSSSALLPNKRFYSGGTISMRGFKRRKLGPLDPDGRPLGGETLFEWAAELRFPVIKRFEGSLFVDTGQVWAHRSDGRLRDLEVAIGPGLVIRTPVGPARADLAFRLTDIEPTQPRRVFHVSIGHPF